MTRVLENLLNRYFKFYFLLCLLAFTVLVLLMNVPRVLSAEAGSDPKPAQTTLIEASESPIGEMPLPEKFYRWQLSKPDASEGIPASYMEFQGNKMLLKVRF